jgi:3-isopropylmalate/(R)-2-methylmalate dehydratase small subunit
MDPVQQVRGRGLPLDRADVDTDQIIPAHWLKRVERTGFGEGLFESWRKDPDFVLNHPHYEGAVVLVAGPNFGCGSSREHAPWALEDYGFDAVISSSFADIFHGNSLKIGLLPIVLPVETVNRIMRAVEADPATEIIIDVGDKRVIVPSLDLEVEFPLDDSTQHRLVNGLDDIGLTLQQDADIASYESKRQPWMPVTTS